MAAIPPVVWFLVLIVASVGYTIRTLLGLAGPAPAPRSDRTEATTWSDVAARHGWHHDPGPDQELGRSFRHLDRFGGDPHWRWTARHIMRGRWQDRPFLALTLSYAPAGRHLDRVRHLTVTSIQLTEGRALPDLRIRPKHIGTRVANRLTARDLRLGTKEFSKAFEVSSADPAFAAAFCTDAMQKLLLRYPGLDVEVDGPWLLIASGGQPRASRIEAALVKLGQIADRIPPELLEP